MQRPAKAFPLLLIALAICAACSPGETGKPPFGAAAAATPPADAQTRKVVAAADAFLATLTPAQKTAVSFAYDDQAQRQRWSNFPLGLYDRKGVTWGELNPGQRAALKTLLAAVLSPEGMTMVEQQMAADDVLKAEDGAAPGGGGPPPGGFPGPPPGGGGPTRRGPLQFGSDLYYVSFLGTPSTTAPWMLQFGGHHLGLNATVVGPNITLAPSLTGGQPLKFVKDGKTIWIVEREVTEALVLVRGLSPAQRAKAIVSSQRIDLVLGPGQDGKVLQPEGLPGSDLTEAQKAQFLKVIESRLDILNADDLAAAMVEVRKNLNQTTFAWYGSTEDNGAAYFRVTAPTLLLEFAPQGLGGDYNQHTHNMLRVPANDYGAAWVAQR